MKIGRLIHLYSRRNPIIFDKKAKFIFIPNNKVAQTSIVRGALKNRCIVKKDNNAIWHLAFFITVCMVLFKRKYYVFTVVRNPYSMVFSAYNYVKHRLNKKLAKYDDFNLFVKELLLNDRENIDPHFLPQSDKILFHGSLEPVNILHLETLNDSWREVLNNIDEEYTELPKRNINVASIKDYSKSYNSESCSIVYKLYKEDFEIFNYKKEIM